MATIKVRYFVEKRAAKAAGPHGRRFFWQPSAALRRAGWMPRRLPGASVHDRPAALAAAERLNAELDAWRKGTDAAPRGPVPGTLDELIARYKASRNFQERLAPKTRRIYSQMLDLASRWAGDQYTAAITVRALQDYYDKLQARTPAQANSMIRTLSMVIAWGVRMGDLDRNVAQAIETIPTKPAVRLWSPEAVATFVETADRLGRHSIGTAVLLNSWLGQREGDVLRLPRHLYRDGALHVTQRKTGARVELPIDLVPHLAERLRAELARQDARGVAATALIVSETTGRPYGEDNFRHRFAEIRAEAAKVLPEIDGLLFMWLRHTAVTRLAEANCELATIAAVTGHSLAGAQKILGRYLVRTAELARVAFTKRLEKDADDAGRGNG